MNEHLIPCPHPTACGVTYGHERGSREARLCSRQGRQVQSTLTSPPVLSTATPQPDEQAITTHPLPGAHEQSWLGLLDIAEANDRIWCLVGGQMTLLHCWERGVDPVRATNDGDAVLDVRSWPTAIADFTALLHRLGYEADVANSSGLQYRWTRDQAQINILLPEGITHHRML